MASESPATPASSQLACGAFRLSLAKPLVMAVLNLTDNSFSGDGIDSNFERAVKQAHQAVEEGADILDIGAESSRPGALGVSESEELARVLPLVTALRPLGVPISVDTVKPVVMCAAIEAGAAIINDINAFRAPGAIEAVQDANVALCVMHMQGTPRTMQEQPHYADVVSEVRDFLSQRIAELMQQGIAQERLIIDPGFGFGKRLEHNLALLRGLDTFAAIAPLLVGLSRKSMLGTITGRAVDQRVVASTTAALLAVQGGANIVRVHDVAATRDALAVWQAYVQQNNLELEKEGGQ